MNVVPLKVDYLKPVERATELVSQVQRREIVCYLMVVPEIGSENGALFVVFWVSVGLEAKDEQPNLR